MAGDTNQQVTVICLRACDVPAHNIIAKQGEERVVPASVAEILVATGRFALQETKVPRGSAASDEKPKRGKKAESSEAGDA